MSSGAWVANRTSALTGWLRSHDPALAATRRAARTAVVMPTLFALCTKVLHSPAMASFAAFGSFSMLLLVDFSGTRIQRLRAQFALAVAWAALICIGTLVARVTWLSVVATVAVAFTVLFAGVVSSVLAGSATALLLAFVLPVATPAPLSALTDRLAGAGLAAAVALPAVTLLWPRPAADPLSGPAARVCRAAAALLRADARATGGMRGFNVGACQIAAEETTAASAALRRMFDATPYRPTGLSTSSRTLVRLVDELTWLVAIVTDRPDYDEQPPACDPEARTARLAAADVLDHAAALLTDFWGDVTPLQSSMTELQKSLAVMEASSTARLPVDQPVGESPGEVFTFISTLDFSFRALELGFAVAQIAGNVELAAKAYQRRWPDRLLGREPGALTKPLASAKERASAHLGWNSVWLHNSVRGAIGLAIAVLLADVTGVQRSFWVLLGTLSVLRSNALNTGQNAARAIMGTVLGSIIGAALLQVIGHHGNVLWFLLQVIGHHGNVLWFLLPIAILIAGIAPAAISFAAGQAAFTVTLVILFNIGQNPDWHIVLLRIQDIALGCGVSIVVALFFWPRGAAAAVDKALAAAYKDAARYLSGSVAYALGHCDATSSSEPSPEPVAAQSRQAAASARRLDDAYRTYLAERGAKPLSLADTTTLVTGVVGLRLAADSVVALWQHAGKCKAMADQSAAHSAILEASDSVTGWYRGLADSLGSHGPIPIPVELRPESAARLVDSVRTDLVGSDGLATATAVRVIWTGDHVDVARRLQPSLAAAAKVAVLN